MTSGNFQSIPLSDITTIREERQRRTIDDIPALADSIARLGLINPITITRDRILVAGERRLSAVRALGWTHIPCQFLDDLDPITRHLIELEENIKRKDISWQEQTLAIAKYHELQKGHDPAWTQEATAKELNVTKASISQHLTVARELKSPEVSNAPTFKTAIEQAQRVARRRDDSLIHNVNPINDTHILNTDFLSWAPTAREQFNFIHCDFPYGINAHKAAGQNASLNVTYDDSPDVYWSLFKCLVVNLDNFCARDAHIIFWFSPNLYCQTWEMLKLLDGFTFEEHSLIWHRPNEGIAPDPYRRPRRCYDMAFFGWRGEARIRRIVENIFSSPTDREQHSHEKSQTMLEHFFGMFVDEYTKLLDPTCGSGSALRAARALGCTKHLGIELDEDHANVARRTLLSYQPPSLPFPPIGR